MQLPEGDRIEYIPWDFKRCAKRRGSRILTEMSPCIRKSLELTSLFVYKPTAATRKGGESQGNLVELPSCCFASHLHLALILGNDLLEGLERGAFG